MVVTVSMENIFGVECANFRPEKFVDKNGNPIFTKQIAFYSDPKTNIERSYSPIDSSLNRSTFRLKCNGCAHSLTVYKLPSNDGLRYIACVSATDHVGKPCTEAAERHRHEVTRWRKGLEIAENLALAKAAGKETMPLSSKLRQLPDGISPLFKTLLNQLCPYIRSKKNWLLLNGSVIALNEGPKHESFLFKHNSILSTPATAEQRAEKQPLLHQPSEYVEKFSKHIFHQHAENASEPIAKLPVVCYHEENRSGQILTSSFQLDDFRIEANSDLLKLPFNVEDEEELNYVAFQECDPLETA